MATKKQKRPAMVRLYIGGKETTHYGTTLKSTLDKATHARLPEVCTVKWGKTARAPSGRVAAGEGRIHCDTSTIHGIFMHNDIVQFVAVRRNPRKARLG